MFTIFGNDYQSRNLALADCGRGAVVFEQHLNRDRGMIVRAVNIGLIGAIGKLLADAAPIVTEPALNTLLNGMTTVLVAVVAYLVKTAVSDMKNQLLDLSNRMRHVEINQATVANELQVRLNKRRDARHATGMDDDDSE